LRRVGITGAEGHIGSTLREVFSDRNEIVPFTLTGQTFETVPSKVKDRIRRKKPVIVILGFGITGTAGSRLLR
jgi:dTDP-4-dehydrorhamnose reductase